MTELNQMFDSIPGTTVIVRYHIWHTQRIIEIVEKYDRYSQIPVQIVRCRMR
jgi:hypothetical protein